MGRLASRDGGRSGSSFPAALFLRLGLLCGSLTLAGWSGRRSGRRRVLAARVRAALVDRLPGNGSSVDASHFDALLPLALDFAVLRTKENCYDFHTTGGPRGN